jgi:putative sporulation protein YtaF
VSTSAALLGNSILASISPKICNIFTMMILVLIGLYFIFEPYIKRKPTNTFAGIILNPDNADIDNSKNIELKEAIFLGVALNINNIGGSFSAGVLGSNIYLVGILSALISFVVLWLGNYLYLFIKNPILNKRISIISGLFLIALGIKQLL